ncbi:MAG: hypothetical protein E7401_03330 [Ruminococcaceae bacterium]|nr:hypothetical protein [Oscillospiraceae bacterium]
MFKRILGFVTAVAVLVSSAAWANWPTGTVNIQKLGDIDGEITLIVELEGGGVLELQQTGALYSEIAAVRSVASVQAEAMAQVADITGSEIQGRVTHIMNALVVDGTYGDIERLEALDEVKAVYICEEYEVIEPVETVAVETVAVGEAEYEEQYDILGSGDIRRLYDGDGIVVGIVDSEFWYDHPAFKTPPTAQALSFEDIESLLSVESFVAESRYPGLKATDVYKSEKIPFAFDYANRDADPKTDNEINYHGTHVAGIVGANGDGLPGVASNTQLVLGKVAVDGSRSATTDLMIYALDDMVRLKVDVINLSMGISAGFSTSCGIFDSVYERIEGAGIAIVAAAGNDGRYGDALIGAPTASAPDYGMVSAPAVNEYSMAVASVGKGNGKLTLSDGTAVIYHDTSEAYCDLRMDKSFSAEAAVEYVDCGRGTAAEYSAIAGLEGKIALVTRGGASFSDSFLGAQNKGALAVILINTEDVYISAMAEGCSIPAAVVTATDGTALKTAAVKTVRVGKREFGASAFSSRGASPDLRLKPEVAAVGENVLSAAYNNGYAYNAGTSMATPQYAGAFASVLDYINQDINSAMSKSAKRVLATQLLNSTAVVMREFSANQDNPPTSPRAQGAGAVSLENAVKSPAVVVNTYNDKVKVELGEISGTGTDFSFIVKNISLEPVTYNLSAEVVTDGVTQITSDGGKNLNVVDGSRSLSGAAVTFDCGESVTVPASGVVTVNARIDLSGADVSALGEVFENGFFVEGFVYLSNTDLPQLSIPFMGFYGDWSAVPAFDGEDYGLLNGLCRAFTKDGASYVARLNSDDEGVRFFSPETGELGFTVQSVRNLREVEFAVYDGSGRMVYCARGSNVGKNMDNEYSIFAGGFDGTASGTQLPDGEYTAVMTAVPDCSDGAENPQVFRFDILMDSVAPTLDDALVRTETVNEKSGRWLWVKAADETSGSPVECRFIDSEGSAISPLYIASDIGHRLFNVTGYSLGDTKIRIFDLAMNISDYAITAADGFVGYYDSVTLKSLSPWSAFVAGGLILNRYDVSKNTDGYTQRLFVWDDNLNPLAASFDVE